MGRVKTRPFEQMEAEMASNPDYANYSRCMEEIKRRQLAIDDILHDRKSTSFRYTNVEFVALQFRKIFELVILATLASHKQFFEGLRASWPRSGK
jgi:hypothetical protein